jgi:DNA modification methylase
MNIIKLHDNRITLIHGDCLEVLPKVKPNAVDMQFWDLPYGTTQNKWDTPLDLTKLWKLAKACSKPTTPFVCTAQAPFHITLGASNIAELKYDWIWEKSRATGHLNAKIQPMRAHEHVLIFYAQACVYNPIFTDGKPYKPALGIRSSETYGDYGIHRNGSEDGKRYPRSVIHFSNANYTNYIKSKHPTEKPLEMLEYYIKTYTNENDVVLDPTAGSFVTAEACIRLNRRCIAIEKSPLPDIPIDPKENPDYFNQGVARCEAAIAELTHA